MTMNYEILTSLTEVKNKPNSNPIKAKTKPIKAKTKPIQTQFKPNSNPIAGQKFVSDILLDIILIDRYNRCFKQLLSK
jgi:hypothetical protein